MAEAQTVIVLTVGDRVHTPEAIGEIRAQLTYAAPTTSEVPFLRVSDTRGQEHLINVREIVEIHQLPA